MKHTIRMEKRMIVGKSTGSIGIFSKNINLNHASILIL
jgi:hypothetical protein